MTAAQQIRPQSRWIVRKLAQECRVTEPEAERALLELLARGHIRIVAGGGPQGRDTIEGIIKSRRGRG